MLHAGLLGWTDLVALSAHFDQSSNNFSFGEQRGEAEAGEFLWKAVSWYFHRRT